MVPGQKPVDGKGKAEVTWLIPKKWIANALTFSVMGRPMSGFGVTGFENFRRKAVATLVNDWTTSLTSSSGNWSNDGKDLVLYGLQDEPSLGQINKPVKYVSSHPERRQVGLRGARPLDRRDEHQGRRAGVHADALSGSIGIAGDVGLTWRRTPRVRTRGPARTIHEIESGNAQTCQKAPKFGRIDGFGERFDVPVVCRACREAT